MVLEGTKSRLSQRADSLRKLVRSEAEAFRGAFNDIKTRINLDVDKTLKYTAGRGGLLGSEGSLIKIPPALVADTVDNVVRFVREQASITRQIVKR
ncbi:MAG: hypothetical protein QXQ68_06010 [Candidatus Nitrosocaldaceae archaeon]